MTEILDAAAEDVETFVVRWLTEWTDGYRTAVVRRAGDPLPFVAVRQIVSKESIEESTVDADVQLDILVDKNDGEDAARDVKDRVHRRMLALGRHLDTDGTLDWMSVTEPPHREPYENDKVIRYVARYRFGQTYDQIDDSIA